MLTFIHDLDKQQSSSNIHLEATTSLLLLEGFGGYVVLMKSYDQVVVVDKEARGIEP